MHRGAKSPRKRATKREVAREYRVSLRTVDTWIAEKKIPFMKLSPRLVRFDLDAVDRPLARYLVKEIS
jgi:excisionase family DNA binding protein